jgi:phage terminase small subunit
VNARRTRFVQEYLIDRNGAAAAVRAGYSPRTARQIAYELLTVPDIAAAVREGEAQIAREAEISRRKVLEGLQEAIELARAKRDAGAMVAGWREIGRLCGYYAAERHEIQVNTRAELRQHDLQFLSDAELLKIIAEGDALSTEHPVPSTLN